MKCSNCEIEIEGIDDGYCPACRYLAGYGTFTDPIAAGKARAERLTNRRWQMRFNRGEIS